MSLSKLLDFIRKPNISEEIDQDVKDRLARFVVECHTEEVESMSEWSEFIEKGVEIAKQELTARSYPWDGAANFKSPIPLEAVTLFGDRATTEILRDGDLVKSRITGKETPEKKARADRVMGYMNYQFNTELENWRDQQSGLFYTLAAYGVVFKKTFFDGSKGHNVSESITYPNFSVNQSCGKGDSLEAFTHILRYTRNDIEERFRAKIWERVDLFRAEDSQEHKDSKIESKEPEEFLEHHCSFDLDEDGYAEPYVVTVHKESSQIVRIVARYEENDIIVMNALGVARKLENALQEAQERIDMQQQDVMMANQLASAQGLPEQVLPELDTEAVMKDLELVRITPMEMITKYGFVRPIDGSYLDHGYLHILSAYAQAVNTTTNQLVDSGTLANLQGGFASKDFRNTGVKLSVKAGEFTPLKGVTAQQLQTGLFPFPFKEPSQVLLALNEQTKNEARGMTSVINFKEVMGPNAPATTTLALLQENMIPTSALMTRILTAMSSEFRKMFNLNRKYIDPFTYRQVLDDFEASFEADFSQTDIDIVPTANAQMTSQMQRLQMSAVLLEQLPAIMQTGGDPKPIMSQFIDNIDSELTDLVYPADGELSPEQQQLQQQQQEMAEMQNQLLEKQNQLQEQQIMLAKQDLDRKDREAEAKAAKTMKEIEKMNTEMVLNLEKAESEDVKNQIENYTKQVQALVQGLGALNNMNNQ
ncbi:MAG: hypothetical protein Unbinned6354contig1000_23 [Prokaryotic dsDNA virus sp.]|nr:hypothetical protein [Cytophagaceae bacterium]QDP54320.1 MAG: hypothetical protein Unbinned6354contig1000_23 [Prokaryotic dsDNA virus sp.]|tara:strand:+ start:5484 stop:7598 length:2115 start_codon:yes stop_codon:yes gene_type:complete